MSSLSLTFSIISALICPISFSFLKNDITVSNLDTKSFFSKYSCFTLKSTFILKSNCSIRVDRLFILITFLIPCSVSPWFVASYFLMVSFNSLTKASSSFSDKRFSSCGISFISPSKYFPSSYNVRISALFFASTITLVIPSGNLLSCFINTTVPILYIPSKPGVDSTGSFCAVTNNRCPCIIAAFAAAIDDFLLMSK